MIPPAGPLAPDGVAPTVPAGAGFDLVLLAHVAFALVAFGAVAVSAAQAFRLRAWRGGPLSDNLARYYAPGVNWPGRSLHAVPVLGVVLVAISGRAYGFDDLWVQLGLGLWLAAAVAAEGVLWPAERRLQRWLAERAGPGAVAEGPGAGRRAAAEGAGRRAAAGVVVAASVVEAALVTATVLMVAKP